VELSVAGAPDGLLAQPLPGAVNLFAQGQGALAPALQIVTSPTLPPGRYTLVVTARQHLSGRVVVARVRVLVTPGAARPYSGGRGSQQDGATSVARGRQVGALPSVRPGLRADRFGAYRATTASSGAALRVGRPIVVAVARRLSVVRVEPIATLRWARGTHPHALLADDGTTCGDSPAGTNRLAGTPYEDAHWTLPGTNQAVPVGTLDDTLPHNGNPRTTNTYYGPLDYVYDRAKDVGQRMNRGHLKGDVFYGSSRDAGNFVAQYEDSNQNVQRTR